MLDLLYAQAAAVRRRWYERHPEARRRLERPVISIGSLTVGGSGKTPLVAAVARYLVARGERPAILSRGYGRRVRDAGVVVVSDGERAMADLDRAGDEPLMLARALPGVLVAVCEDRYLAGALAERRLGATVHLLDDGFQHVKLARDLDVLVTSPGEITNGRVLPLGRLRESIGAAARAHVAVVVGADAATARSEAWELGISQFCAARRLTGASGASGARVLAVAGIAFPGEFFDGLRGAGWNVADTLAFPDHHRYSPDDVRAIAQKVSAAGAEFVVTTEKDLVRFERLGALPFTLGVVPLILELDQAEILFASIDAALARRREVA